MNASEKTMDKIVNLCKGRGYVYPSSEIYGGLSNSWDFGPLGAELKNNVKKAWWKRFVQANPYNVGLDSAILMNSQVWVASGHVVNFNDPLIDCKCCKMRHRADKLIGEVHPEVNVDAMSFDEMDAYIAENEDILCPVCGKHSFTPIRKFNLMFKTAIGVTEDSSSTCYLRPETAQGIFVNFANIQRTTRKKLPFGVCQVGKAFRNEITPGNFTFRTREFEQMEIEYFCREEDGFRLTDEWLERCLTFYENIGIPRDKINVLDVPAEERAFYSKKTYDLEYLFPFGLQELQGVAYRTCYDLTRHQEGSGKPMEYFDETTREYGEITGTDVFSIAGADLAPDSEKEDEYVALADKDGVEHKAEIEYSDLQNVKAKMAAALPAGEYTLCVYTRSGMGDEFGVKKTTRKVTVK